MNNNCKLCGKNKELQKSHIFPRAFYRQVKDNGQYIFLKENGDYGTAQSDWWEYLFCYDCEQIISSYESVAIPVLKGVNNQSKNSCCYNMTYTLTEKEFKYFELFKLSLLYRFLLADAVFTRYYVEKIISYLMSINKDIFNFYRNNKVLCFYETHLVLIKQLKMILINGNLPKEQYWDLKIKKIYDFDNDINISNIILPPKKHKGKMVFILDGLVFETNVKLNSYFKNLEKKLFLKIEKVSPYYFEELPFLAYSSLNK